MVEPLDGGGGAEGDCNLKKHIKDAISDGCSTLYCGAILSGWDWMGLDGIGSHLSTQPASPCGKDVGHPRRAQECHPLTRPALKHLSHSFKHLIHFLFVDPGLP